MPDLSAPDDPYGLLGGNWTPESESAYSTASETVAQNSGGYTSAAEEARRRATAVQEGWSGKSGTTFAEELSLDSAKFVEHAHGRL
jgi:hypothetical protein